METVGKGYFGVKKTDQIIQEFYVPKLDIKAGKIEEFIYPIFKMEGTLHTYHVDHLGSTFFIY